MKKFILTSLLVLMLFASGCWKEQETNPTIPIDLKTGQDLENASAKIAESTTIIEEKTESITEESQSIQENAIEAQAKVPEGSKAAIAPHLDSIKQSSKTIIDDAKAIDKANMNLVTAKELVKNAKDKVATTDRILEKIVKERDEALAAQKKAEEEKDSQLHKMLQYLIILCIAGVGVSTVVFFMSGSKLGIAGAAACGLILIVAIAVETYLIYFAIAGGILLVGVVGLLIYDAWTKRKALKEVVDTVEITRDNLTPEVKDKIFGAGDDNGLMKRIQSPSTIRIVERTKNRIPNLWIYAKENKKGNLNGEHDRQQRGVP